MIRYLEGDVYEDARGGRIVRAIITVVFGVIVVGGTAWLLWARWY